MPAMDWSAVSCGFARVEWGSVADWVSGIGSLAAVFAALLLARSEARRADRAQRNAELLRIGRHNGIVAEAKIAVTRGRNAAKDFAEVIAGERRADHDVEFGKWVARLDEVREVLAEIRKLPNEDAFLALYLAKAEKNVTLPPYPARISYGELQRFVPTMADELDAAREEADQRYEAPTVRLS